MADDYERLEETTESTRGLKNRQKFAKWLEILTYIVIWTVAIVVFWVLSDAVDRLGYAVIVLYLILPLLSFVISVLIAYNTTKGKHSWRISLFFGFMLMLTEYVTTSMANMVACHHMNAPHFNLFIVGALISLAGIGVGTFLRRTSKNQGSSR